MAAKAKAAKIPTFHLEFDNGPDNWVDSSTYPKNYKTQAIAQSAATRANNHSKKDGLGLVYRVAKGRNQGGRCGR